MRRDAAAHLGRRAVAARVAARGSCRVLSPGGAGPGRGFFVAVPVSLAWRSSRVDGVEAVESPPDAIAATVTEGKERTPSTHTRFSTCRTVSLNRPRASSEHRGRARRSSAAWPPGPDVARGRDDRHPFHAARGPRPPQRARVVPAARHPPNTSSSRCGRRRRRRARGAWPQSLRMATWPACGGFQDLMKSTISIHRLRELVYLRKLPDGRAVEAVQDPNSQQGDAREEQYATSSSTVSTRANCSASLRTAVASRSMAAPIRAACMRRPSEGGASGGGGDRCGRKALRHYFFDAFSKDHRRCLAAFLAGLACLLVSLLTLGLAPAPRLLRAAPRLGASIVKV